MNRIYLLVILVFCFVSCQNNGPSLALDALEYELEKTKKELAITNGKLGAMRSGALVHVVYFDLKESLTDGEHTDFVKELARLENIPQVQNFQQGGFKDLGDQRALSDYEWVIQITLKDKVAYETYQASKIHQDVKGRLVSYLAKAPATYDYIIR